MSARKPILIMSIMAFAFGYPLYSKTNNEIFERMIGPAARINPKITAMVLGSKPGTKFRHDTDGDGKIDTIYFIDNDDRHPLRVKVVDGDGPERDGDDRWDVAGLGVQAGARG